MSIFIIAEAGVNHNGDRDTALQLINVAAEAGADAIKFQTFKAKHLVTQFAETANYQKKSMGRSISQFELLSGLELSFELHYELFNYCKKRDIKFMSTAFDSPSLEFLVNNLRLETLKVSSGDLTNGPFLLEHARTGLDIILSTGMSSLSEIREALGIIAFGLLKEKSAKPTLSDCKDAFESDQGKKLLEQKVSLLHCVTEYPAPNEELNLKAISTLKNEFNLPTGYSDHSEGIIIPIAAAAIGVSVIEKHFTLDKAMEGPDHLASLEPTELHEMIIAIRSIEAAMGNGEKIASSSEIKNKDIARKSIVAKTNIKKGEKYTKKNIAIRRPGQGMSPNNYWSLLNHSASSNYEEGDYIDE